MIAPAKTNNAKKIDRVEVALAEMFNTTLRSGFHGTITLEVSIQDGYIQHFRRKLDQIEK